MGGEELGPAQADPLDQAAHEDVGAKLLESARSRAVEPQEAAGSDRAPRAGSAGSRAPPRAPRPCRACGGGRSSCSGRDRPSGVSIGGRVSARTDGRRVVRVGEHAKPGDRVAHLGALEERRGAREAEGDAALLERRSDEAAVALQRADHDAGVLGAELARVRAAARSRAPRPGPSPARCDSARTRRPARARRARSLSPTGSAVDRLAHRSILRGPSEAPSSTSEIR